MDTRWVKRTAQFFTYPIFRKIAASVAFFSAYAWIEYKVEIPLLGADFEFSQGLHTLLGVSLSMLMVFRNNSSYDRWWEGRKLWGQLVNTCRSLALLCSGQAGLSDEERAFCIERIRRFPFQLRDHLRGPWPAPRNLPVDILGELMNAFSRWDRDGKLSHNVFLRIEHHLTELSNVMGGCERIRSTPLPLSHRAIVPQVVVAYLLALPWGLPDHPTSIFIEAMVAYFLISLEMVAEMVEEPFGDESDDLPLTAISTTIEKSMRQISEMGWDLGSSATLHPNGNGNGNSRQDSERVSTSK